jgi:Beta propeller domain
MAATLAVSACTATHRTSPPQPPVAPAAAALVAFDSCADLLTSLRSATKATMADPRYGLAQPGAGAPVPGPRAQGLAGTAPDAAGGAAPDAAAGAERDMPGTDYSTTNTAEPGVDEPDLVKTDGRRIVTAVGGELRVIDAASRQVTGTLALPEAAGRVANVLLFGDHVLVALAPTFAPVDDGTGPRPYLVPGVAGTQRLLLVDLATPVPAVVSRYDIDGQLVDARQVGPVVRLVVTSRPRLLPGTEIDRAGLDQWLPGYALSTGDGTVRGRVDCGAVSRPARYSGTSLLTVLTMDLSKPALGTGDPVTIVADARTVYSTGTSLYVAGDAGAADAGGTALYLFDTSGAGRPRYLAAGSVPGTVLNQYALSEWRGDLRVATTYGDSSSVYVIRRQGGGLRQVGAVGGLGKGQRVYGVRFAGPVGYVVTFRQTDPLYTVDLRDPTHPAVTGALELTGYSAYLHPIGDGQLIGLGQEADTGGRAEGTQVSLFDVADPTAPRRLAHYVLPQSQSQAQFDPHAFLYWTPTGLLAVPVTSWMGNRVDRGGMLALRVQDGRITPLSWPASNLAVALRTLVVDRTVWTVAADGVAANDLATLAPQAWLPF